MNTKKDVTVKQEKTTIRLDPEVKLLMQKNAQKRRMTFTSYIDYLIRSDSLADKAYQPAELMQRAIRLNANALADRENTRKLAQDAIRIVQESNDQGKSIIEPALRILFDAYMIRSEVRTQELYQLVTRIPAKLPKALQLKLPREVKKEEKK